MSLGKINAARDRIAAGELETPATLDAAGDRMIRQMVDGAPELEQDLRSQLKPGAAEVLGLTPPPAWADDD